MSARSKARHVQKSARERGLQDSYMTIRHLVLTHWEAINEYKHTHEDVTWGEAADAIVLPLLRKKDEG